MKESTASLQQTFWRWFSFSVLALIVAAALPAMSADVFIDEGDGDFNATPVSTPHADKAPASEDLPPLGAGLEPQAAPEAAPLDLEMPADSGGDLAMPGETTAQPVKPAKKAASKAEKKSKKKIAKADKKSKKAAKKTAKKADKKSKKKHATTEKSSKRKVASFAGGQYATTSRSCAMESAPGAGDSVGSTVAARKLWVEDSGNTSYWKVYTKSGGAAFVPRDCF